jgi:diguanylate cyclase (GGDEF)-like protein
MVEIMSTLNESAHNDPMTGLYNRMGFEKSFGRTIAIQKKFYIMVFDLDKTKIINDNFGHLKGDKYIISAAKIIKDQIGKNGFVGRTGGDEFLALIENVNEEEIENIKFIIKNRVSNIFYKQNTQISIGYSKYKKDGETFEELLSFADKRMYEDKRKIKEIFFKEQEIII